MIFCGKAIRRPGDLQCNGLIRKRGFDEYGKGYECVPSAMNQSTRCMGSQEPATA